MGVMRAIDYDTVRACSKNVVDEHKAPYMFLIISANAGLKCAYLARHYPDAQDAMILLREHVSNWKEWKVRECRLTHKSGGEVWILPGDEVHRRMPGYQLDLVVVG